MAEFRSALWEGQQTRIELPPPSPPAAPSPWVNPELKPPGQPWITASKRSFLALLGLVSVAGASIGIWKWSQTHPIGPSNSHPDAGTADAGDVAAVPATSVSAVPATSASAVPAASASASPSTGPAKGGDGSNLPPNRGYVIIKSRISGAVYFMGVFVGLTDQRIEVECGPKYMRLGSTPAPGAEAAKPPNVTWTSEGKSGIVACRTTTTIELNATIPPPPPP